MPDLSHLAPDFLSGLPEDLDPLADPLPHGWAEDRAASVVYDAAVIAHEEVLLRRQDLPEPSRNRDRQATMSGAELGDGRGWPGALLMRSRLIVAMAAELGGTSRSSAAHLRLVGRKASRLTLDLTLAPFSSLAAAVDRSTPPPLHLRLPFPRERDSLTPLTFLEVAERKMGPVPAAFAWALVQRGAYWYTLAEIERGQADWADAMRRTIKSLDSTPRGWSSCAVPLGDALREWEDLHAEAGVALASPRDLDPRETPDALAREWLVATFGDRADVLRSELGDAYLATGGDLSRHELYRLASELWGAPRKRRGHWYFLPSGTPSA